MSFFAERMKAGKRQHVAGLDYKMYGSTDNLAKAGDYNGSIILYHSNGKFFSKRRLSRVDTHIMAIHGELWSMNDSLPMPPVVPMDAIPGFRNRRTLRPFRDKWFTSEFAIAFREAVLVILACENGYSEELAKALAAHGVEIAQTLPAE